MGKLSPNLSSGRARLLPIRVSEVHFDKSISLLAVTIIVITTVPNDYFLLYPARLPDSNGIVHSIQTFSGS